LAKTLSL